MGYDSIHETLQDIFDTMKDGIESLDKLRGPKKGSIQRASSIARATSALTMVFPVICTNTLPIEIASMIAKAIERKNVAMMQMVFSAYNITNSADAVEHLTNFHTNMDATKMDVDKFIDIMDSLSESASTIVPLSIVREIAEDCKRNINYVLEDSINESSMLSFKEINKYGSSQIIKEADDDEDDSKVDYAKLRYQDNKEDRELRRQELQQRQKEQQDRENDAKIRRDNDYNLRKDELNQRRDELNQRKAEQDAEAKRKEQIQQNRDDEDRRRYNQDRTDKLNQNDIQNTLNREKNNTARRSEERQYLAQQLLPADVKKANEMQPSLMIVNFYVNDKDRDLNVAQQFVAGVKSKLYAVESADIINRIITKHINSDVLLRLVQVSTREISFVKDFLLGLDDAKLNTINRSKKGSGAAIFNALEKRALNGKTRKALKSNNMYKAISTLVVSMEEVNQLRKYNNIDLTKVKNAANIMDQLNLLYFVIVDTTSEAVHMLTDGDSMYETISFTNLERDNGDSAYKKVISLMTKVAR